MKKQYITPTTTVFVCRSQQLLSVSTVVNSSVGLEWGGEDLTGLESDAPLLDILMDVGQEY